MRGRKIGLSFYKDRKMKIFVWVVVFSLWLSSALAGEYFVSQKHPQASDKNPGTIEAPWKTISHAVISARSGDVVRIKAGIYRESVTITTSGISLSAFEDDQVVISGADDLTFNTRLWKPVEDVDGAWAMESLNPPRQIFIDGRRLEQGMNSWVYDPDGKRLIIVNLGSLNPGYGPKVQFSVRDTLLNINASQIRISGLCFEKAGYDAIILNGQQIIMEDCVIEDTNFRAITIVGGSSTIRRCTILRSGGTGIWLVNDDTRECIIQENLLIGCAKNPDKAFTDIGTIKMNGSHHHLICNNILVDGGASGIWGDGINTASLIYGNTIVGGGYFAFYIEYDMNGNEFAYNTTLNSGMGFGVRQASRNLIHHNWLFDSSIYWPPEAGGESTRPNKGKTTHGLVVAHQSKVDAPSRDNVFRRNLVQIEEMAVDNTSGEGWFGLVNDKWQIYPFGEGEEERVARSNLWEDNAYTPGTGPFAKWSDGKSISTFEEFRKISGMEKFGRCGKIKPEDEGLYPVFFRVISGPTTSIVVPMLGNPSMELPSLERGITEISYPMFWRPGMADGTETRWHPTGGAVDSNDVREALKWYYKGNWSPENWVARKVDALAGMAHSGIWFLKVRCGDPEKLPSSGVGWRSVSLPAVPREKIGISVWIRGEKLETVKDDGLPLVGVHFISSTGQNRQEVLVLKPDQAKQFRGDFDWQQVAGTITVPATASRFSVFLGLRDCKGVVCFDDIEIGLK